MPNNFPILVSPPAAAQRSTATLMKTGQTTSYRTGDDGDLERGRLTDFFTLAENNPFGNTNRFTDELGGQTYANDIVIDWSTYNGSTVLGIYRLYGTTQGWDALIDAALILSIGSFISGWYLPNARQLFNFANFETANGYWLNYAPLNISAAVKFWTSNISKLNTANAIGFAPDTNIIVPAAKTITNTYRLLPVRDFTVTGTTLT